MGEKGEVISRYELAESMLRAFEEELKYIRSSNYVDTVPRIAQATEYLAKALIHAMGWNENVKKDHEVSKFVINICRTSPVPLSENEIRAIVGVAILNAMLCNRVMWNVAKYGFESLALRPPEFAEKTPFTFSDWREMLRNCVSLLERYYQVVKNIVKKAGTFVIEVTEHDLEDGKVIKEIEPRPTARYAHARVRVRLCDELLWQSYQVRTEFEVESEKGVHCEVCLWDKDDNLVNARDDSPKDFIYIKDRGSITVKAGNVNGVIIRDIEPRVWLTENVKKIKVEIKKLST